MNEQQRKINLVHGDECQRPDCNQLSKQEW